MSPRPSGRQSPARPHDTGRSSDRDTDAAAGLRRVSATGATHYENFPVASWLLPARAAPAHRRDLRLCAHRRRFRRRARPRAGERLALLDEWERRLSARAASNRHPARRDLAEAAVRRRRVDATLSSALCATRSSGSICPVDLFDDLLSAFRQDVTTTRYETWAEVLDYCRRSANPVGRLVLAASAIGEAELDRGLGRGVHGASADELLAGSARSTGRAAASMCPRKCGGHTARILGALDRGSMTRPWTARSATCGRAHARALRAGRPVCDGVSGRLRYELRATWLGGTRVLERLERSGFDVFAAPTHARRRRRVSDSLARRRGAGRAGTGTHGIVARDTSFYLRVPDASAGQAHAIVAVWDFCRAVDDAVDEAAARRDRAPRTRSRELAGEVDRVVRHGAPLHAARPRTCKPLVARVRALAAALRRSDRRRRDGPRADRATRPSTSWSDTAAASPRPSV